MGRLYCLIDIVFICSLANPESFSSCGVFRCDSVGLRVSSMPLTSVVMSILGHSDFFLLEMRIDGLGS
jgi:hypothetical protein